jgi:lysozyme family protein
MIAVTNVFEACIRIILGFEGWELVSTDRNDSGGVTKFGISAKAFPDIDIPSLTLLQAIELYHKHYWLPVKGAEFPSWLALLMLDCAVNQGVQTAIKTLQKVLYVKVDGVYGPITRAAVIESFPEKLLVSFQQERARLYLSMDNPTEERYEKGWINRLIHGTQISSQWLTDWSK